MTPTDNRGESVLNEITVRETDDSLKRRVAREANWLIKHDAPPLVMAMVACVLEQASGLALVLERRSREEHEA